MRSPLIRPSSCIVRYRFACCFLADRCRTPHSISATIQMALAAHLIPVIGKNDGGRNSCSLRGAVSVSSSSPGHRPPLAAAIECNARQVGTVLTDGPPEVRGYPYGRICSTPSRRCPCRAPASFALLPGFAGALLLCPSARGFHVLVPRPLPDGAMAPWDDGSPSTSVVSHCDVQPHPVSLRRLLRTSVDVKLAGPSGHTAIRTVLAPPLQCASAAVGVQSDVLLGPS
ncbi:hypothetical protein C2E23DRAFT_19379 [Lenzites betulinus]|nr:hypothetical protein C2E23DRAFT_19379 [Lenzites betulinus]